MEVEFTSLVAGRHPRHLRRFRSVMQRTLASPYCRRVLYASEAGRRTLLADLDSRDFQYKIKVVDYSVPARSFVKKYGAGKVKLHSIRDGWRILKTIVGERFRN